MFLKMYDCSVSSTDRAYAGEFLLRDVLVNNADDMSQEELSAFIYALETEGKARILGGTGYYAEFEVFNPYLCKDCQTDTSAIDEYYMVMDEVWSAAEMEPRGGMLCIGCLETRIGRQLTSADFPAYPVNAIGGPFNHSDRLKSRITCIEIKEAA